jgi:hypothetical protein
MQMVNRQLKEQIHFIALIIRMVIGFQIMLNVIIHHIPRAHTFMIVNDIKGNLSDYIERAIDNKLTKM